MLRFLVLISTILAVALGGVINQRPSQLNGRVIGGEKTNIESYPYQVSVRFMGNHFCGGAIIGSRVVLTAAHCLFIPTASSYGVEYGTTEVGINENVIVAERLQIHESYNPETMDFDVALIFLSADIPFSARAQPIALAGEEPAAGTRAIVTGWPMPYENGSSHTVLEQTELVVVERDVCERQYDGLNAITEQMLCAADEGKGPCMGDSGGPLAVDGQLVGIISWSMGCADPNFSGVYTNVANLNQWINRQMA